MSYFLSKTLITTTSITSTDMGVSQDFLTEILNKYGILGVIIVGFISALILFIKYSTKKLDIDEKKAAGESDAGKALIQLSGLMDQAQRESSSHQLTIESYLEDIKKENAIVLIEVSKFVQGHEKDNSEVRRELSEVKTILRDIQRDVLYRERERN